MKMSQFKLVKKVPAKLKDGEYFIGYPDFAEEINDSCARVAQSGKKRLTENNMLRNALVLIGMRYEPEFNAFHVPLVNYEGLPYSTAGDVSALLVRILEKHAPHVIDAKIVHDIKNRPAGTSLIYFGGPKEKSELFIQQGLAEKSGTI
jgi:hypothetical protein